ncbi:MAG: sterol desaturase family protein [Deltaproteobacteria bacterium]|nr:sterol desaturase family protein [Deltaproteobacteria bacterium]
MEVTRTFIFGGGLLFFLILELLIPYRPSSVPRVTRWFNNLGIAVFNSIILNLLFAPFIMQTIAYVHTRQRGVLNLWPLQYWVKVLATVVFLDLILYVWHLLNHEVPFFWRFHRVHHSDLNMDVSTASRFHIGELSISAVIKIGLIFFLGADLFGVFLFESLVVLTSQFHHSSLTVPVWFERLYWTLFVPPSMHRIHHSVVIKERNSNYGTIFSLWDRILETLLSQIDQARIKIGMGAYQNPEKIKLHHLLIMPFTKSVK